MAKIEIELEQHSPLIQFQADQNEAGLRASEVKPRLDLYLLKKYKDKLRPYMKPNQEKALNYSMHIRYNNNVKKIQLENEKNGKIVSGYCLICNLGKAVDSKKIYRAVFLKNVVMEIQTPFDDLVNKYIMKELDNFLIENSFGNRTSKGYGCFYQKGCDTVSLLEKYGFEELVTLNQKGLKNKSEIDIHKELFGKIQNKWRTIKCGNTNIKTNVKTESLIDKYVKRFNCGSVKDKIKKVEYGTYIDYKDLLGLSTMETWGNENLIKVVNTVNDFEIKRFKSPIQIKIYNDKTNKILKAYYRAEAIDKNHKIFGSVCKAKLGKHEEVEVQLPDEFDFEDFIKFIESNK